MWVYYLEDGCKHVYVLQTKTLTSIIYCCSYYFHSALQEILIRIFAHTHTYSMQSFFQNFWDWGLTPKISGPLCPFHILLSGNLKSTSGFSDSLANSFWILQEVFDTEGEVYRSTTDRLTPYNTFTERVKWVTARQAIPLIVSMLNVLSWNALVQRVSYTLRVSYKHSWAGEALNGCSTAVTDVFQSHSDQCTLPGLSCMKKREANTLKRCLFYSKEGHVQM